MTHWDPPPPGAWDDPYGDPDRQPETSAGRHAAPDDAASTSFNGFALGQRKSDWGTPDLPARTPSTWPPPPVSGLPNRPVSPSRPALPNRPVSPSRPVSPPPPPAMAAPPVWNPGPGPGSPISGNRSHWVDQSGVDHRGRIIIDADDIDPHDRSADRSLNRRRALLALGTVVTGTAAALSPPGLHLFSKLFGGPAPAAPTKDAQSHDNLPGNGSDRPAGRQPSAARTYTDQNESYMGSTAGDHVRKNTPKTGTVAQAGPAQAAVSPQAKPVAVSALGADPARHLANRLTFGATPELLAEINRIGIDQWLGNQLAPETIDDSKLDAKLAELTTLSKTVDQLRADRDANSKAGIAPDQEIVEAAIARQIWSQRQVLEVMVDFWNDFLHVTAFFDGSDVQRPSFDKDVIRKYALDNYPDMFVAANRNAALLNYLDQDQSTKNAINENLARENLELFTVGVDGGYTEVDVRQAAILQTGRSIKDDKYFYRADQHKTGPVTIMGFTHPNDTAAGGEKAAEDYFRYLAMHPSTARYIAVSLATRLVSDTPPQSLVDKVAAAYLASKGQIKPTLTTLLSSTEFWGSVGQKVRRPMEYLVATYRTLGVRMDTPAAFKNTNANASPFLQGLRQIRQKMDELGQFPTGQPTPNGYPDVFVAWTSVGTMVNGWNEAYNILSGNRPMFTYVNPSQLVGATTPATAGAYVDALAQRLVHQALTPAQKAAVLEVAGVADASTVDGTFNGAIRAVARTILASPQHHLR
jgi:uncharacterized protein (DUF1800 family)